jgi:uncharacterized protein YodC (DUF2158 family)
MEFKVGDVVRLNSGGPEMTVVLVAEKKFSHGGIAIVVACTWFEGKRLKEGEFKPETIGKV